MVRKRPFANGDNGLYRDDLGRFLPGNRGGPGNPVARQTAALRSALLAAVGTKDLQAIVRKLIEAAKAGDVAAAREVLDRVLGRSVARHEVDAAGAGCVIKYYDAAAKDAIDAV